MTISVYFKASSDSWSPSVTLWIKDRLPLRYLNLRIYGISFSIHLSSLDPDLVSALRSFIWSEI